ncbi:MAG: hypothetical protein JNK48_31745 [Bryobacterales bacterium]|nr:hypothetical protein [Bryobacterales bacterium]
MKLISLFTLWAASLVAAPVFTLDPTDPARSGPAGTFVGWNVSVAPDASEWITILTSFVINETNPFGFYIDAIGPQGGPVSGVLPPSPEPAWLTMLGEYFIAPLTPVGSVNSGSIRILYERYSDDPSVCPQCFLDSGEAGLDFSVTVDAPVPEPSTWLMIAPALALPFLRRRR